MKALKEYLLNQKDLALMSMSNELSSESCNLVLVKHWLDRVVVLEQMIRELNTSKNGK